MIVIDGSFGEGGGQILRTSIALASALGKAVKVVNIRANRPTPGLRPQHLVAVKCVAAISQAETSGDQVGSRELTFNPKGRMSNKFKFDIGTAGSISLVLQALIPAAVFSPGPLDVELSGGTDVKWSPTIDYLRFVTIPILERFGCNVSLELRKRGHYPKGGGAVRVTTRPTKQLGELTLLERGDLTCIKGISHCVMLPKHVAERQAKAAEDTLRSAGYQEVDVKLETYESDRDHHLGPGSGILLYALATTGATLGSDGLGERGKPAEVVGEETGKKLIHELKSGAAVDRHMGDILIPYMALATGTSKIYVSQITQHTLTNIEVARKMTGADFHLDGTLSQAGRITVVGLGLTV